jgi:riboflavin kinase
MDITVKGKVFAGKGEGKKFLRLCWVRTQINEKLGFEPYLGTLNLYLSNEARAINLLNKFKGLEITPEKGYWSGRLYKALINGKVHGAVVRPEVPYYSSQILEVIAPVFLREKLSLKDGDEVEVKILLE